MTFKLEIDASQWGLRMVLKDWQEEAIKVLWGNPQKGLISKRGFRSGQQEDEPRKHLEGFDHQLPRGYGFDGCVEQDGDYW